MKLLPFPALRPATATLARRIASLPYDVMDTAEARALAAGNPDSFLHVVRSEIDLPEETDPHDAAVYAKARENLDAMVRDGRLRTDRDPTLYLYRQTLGEHRQTAIVACCPIDDYAAGTILRHEKTRQDKEDDRTRHILATNANTGQVFLAYADVPAVDALVAAECAAKPCYDFAAEDGVGHCVWKVRNSAALVTAFEAVPRAYIADGHHRSAASFRAGTTRRSRNPAHTGREEYNGFMACLFPASQLRILPYNRLLLALNGLAPEAFLEEVRRRFKVTPADAPAPAGPRQCCLYVGGRWHRLDWTVDGSLSPAARLDVSVLQDRLLAPVLGIEDPRTDARIAFVGGVRGATELERRVDRGEAAAAFAMAPVSIGEVMAIADAGAVMPPKSTWFEPKLRSGLLVHRLDRQASAWR